MTDSKIFVTDTDIDNNNSSNTIIMSTSIDKDTSNKNEHDDMYIRFLRSTYYPFLIKNNRVICAGTTASTPNSF